MRPLFFYAYPHNLDHFTQITVPSLISSLSQTLKLFYPFASKLILSPPPQKPYVLFTEGDSVSFTVAYCSDYDFDYLVSDETKPVSVLRQFAPRLPPPQVSPDGSSVESLQAIQVTLFPNKGICIGVGSRHVVADGMSFNNFFQSWTSICRSNGVVDSHLIPSFNREAIEDPYDLEHLMLQKWQDYYSSFEECDMDNLFTDRVRSTFLISRSQIEKLKKYFSCFLNNLSSFVVTCSFIWVCLLKSLEESSDDDANDKACCLSVPTNCRNRLGLPATYFGNCIVSTYVVANRSELVGHNGFIVAARAIINNLKELERQGPQRGLQRWVTADEEQFSSLFEVFGSPKFAGQYREDFGWGFPNKAFTLHSDSLNSLSLRRCKDDEGGIQIGLELKRAEMDAFTKHFYQGLKKSFL
ncbi:coumaroyl-CoA:anthocyanidin 3-O-glucoside-6''-O-coumaroyltransferase 2-like [Rutidosis leptorrhynchoides]|uniref:coumaroyl-CoA:anthocyanidin 3-O-glucoside-6''-O-coumaroyltransferase 2-like n=1 Tax=Rutidosis leptorrhynchoides TaxID=125765 RepID=UPI003A995DCC